MSTTTAATATTAPRPAIEGMHEAKRPTGPILAMILSLVFMMVGQLPFSPLLLSMPTTTFAGQMVMTTTFAGPLLLFLLWVRFKENRPLASLGFHRPAGSQILLGAALGIALTTVTVLVNVAAGTATLGNLTWSMLPLALLLLLGFAIQASTEEVADRGFVMQAVARKWGFVAALIIQTVLFAGLHGFNGGLTWVAWGNLCGVAVFLGLWVWVTGRLWGACAFHTVWNWSQGNLWGAPVSHQQVGTSIAHYSPAPGASDMITGGSFGLEGSVIPLIGFIIGSIILVVMGRRAHR